MGRPMGRATAPPGPSPQRRARRLRSPPVRPPGRTPTMPGPRPTPWSGPSTRTTLRQPGCAAGSTPARCCAAERRPPLGAVLGGRLRLGVVGRVLGEVVHRTELHVALAPGDAAD